MTDKLVNESKNDDKSLDDRSLKDLAIKIGDKDYVLVSDRVVYFNEHYKNGMIKTELLTSFDSDMVVVRATITPDIGHPDRFFNAYSQAKWGAGMVNRTAALENCETSAVGRALAFMGIGVIDSIASVDEINKAKEPEFAQATPENDVYERAMSAPGTVCKKCGAPMIKNPHTGNWFCKDKCWLKGGK